MSIKAMKFALSRIKNVLGRGMTDELYLIEAESELVQAIEEAEKEPDCSTHPDAPHGFDRNASHNAGRYVCECESWIPPEQSNGRMG